MRLSQVIKKIPTNGQFFKVTFFKRTTDEIRNMICRRGVKKDLKGVGLPYNPKEKYLITVFDLQKKQYRMVNLCGLISLTVDGNTYVVDHRRVHLMKKGRKS